MKARVLVTGAAGYIGQELVKRLLKEGFDINVLLRSNRMPDSIEQRVKVFKGDILD